jgi:hypothetical protein
VLRWSSPDNFYLLALDGQRLVLTRVMDGMVTPLQSMVFPVRSNSLYTFRFRAVGSQLFAMVWPTDQPAPTNWQIEQSDNALSTGHAGIHMSGQNNVQAKVTIFMEDAP